jgi:hypothetical protein
MQDKETTKATTTEADASSSRRLGMSPIGATIAIVFGLLYAYDLWEAVSPLLELPGYYALVGLEPADVPWALLIVGVLVPPIVYALAYVLGRKRSALDRALIFLVGLAIVATLSLTGVFLEQFLRPVAQVVGL